MGKYIRKVKTAGEIAVMEVSQTLGVSTRARTLALQRLQKSSPPPSDGGSYLQLRSRRLQKPTILVDSKREKPNPRRNANLKSNSKAKSGSRGLVQKKGSSRKNVGEVVQKGKVEGHTGDGKDLGAETSFGENRLEIEGRERNTRESTPCSLIRDPDAIRTPGSSTRPTSSTEANRRRQNSISRHIPTAHDMDDFFSGAEEEQQRQFVEKYNFDPVNDKPLPGQYEWEKLDP
ncbi:putative Cyclin dependent kinase inhibitor [Tripterygium wilfordii]|uniref:Putative Cyclin dependent kinase inhibitor n=1 Tax=Tripterygium wilfordii TaxID=458696 RepID=A0A7J7CWR9_TRIWF|nr:cyclin-dependent kinase inhibitor 5-like [Tripterygium wilfordii]KAF5738513.1 putative Cyclin dependent kinase inhibitor [Tripterygium wilfordii]